VAALVGSSESSSSSSSVVQLGLCRQTLLALLGYRQLQGSASSSSLVRKGMSWVHCQVTRQGRHQHMQQPQQRPQPPLLQQDQLASTEQLQQQP
jgi:hypothetical protein